MPQAAHTGDHGQCLLDPFLQQLRGRTLEFIVHGRHRQLALAQQIAQGIAQSDFVAQRQLYIDALNAVGVLGHARQRNDHVFVDLERVGVPADGRRAFAVQPEFFARLGADGDKTFAAAGVGQAHHFRRDARHVVGVVTGDIAEQHHFRQTAALGFGGVAHGFQIAVVQMLQTCQQRAGLAGNLEHIVFDLDDARHRLVRRAEKLQTHSARVGRHAVQYPTRTRDQAVAAFFLHAGQTA